MGKQSIRHLGSWGYYWQYLSFLPIHINVWVNYCPSSQHNRKERRGWLSGSPHLILWTNIKFINSPVHSKGQTVSGKEIGQQNKRLGKFKTIFPLQMNCSNSQSFFIRGKNTQKHWQNIIYIGCTAPVSLGQSSRLDQSYFLMTNVLSIPSSA